MLNKIKDMKSVLVASKSADKHPQFQVDEKDGVQVKVFGPEQKLMAHFFVGKMGSDFMSTYIRKADKNKVLLVDGYLKPTFAKGTRGWRDRTIFNFDASQVQRLTLVSEKKGEVALEAQDNGEWQILKPDVAPADKDKVDKIVKAIAKLSADDFAVKKTDKKKETESKPGDVLKEYKLDSPQSKIMVDLKDGTSRVLLIGKKSTGRYYVKRPDKDVIFMVYKSRIDNIFKNPDELKAQAKPNDSKASSKSDAPDAKENN